MLDSQGFDFLVSALTECGRVFSLEHFFEWFDERKKSHRFNVERIPFAEMRDWDFEHSTGNLRHVNNGFFTIEGIWVETNAGPINEWAQPVINQPEIGILGIIVKKIDGILHFLMHANMEPGNLNTMQLAPTLQATRSNYLRVHRGRAPLYLEHFIEGGSSRILIDSLQSEQGARFLRKRNRNIIVEVFDDIEVFDDFCWLTLGQIQRLIKHDNLVNMDARSVLSCVPCVDYEMAVAGIDQLRKELEKRLGSEGRAVFERMDEYRLGVLRSLMNVGGGFHRFDEIISWFTQMKVKYELDVERIPLKYVRNWERDELEIRHEDRKYFSVIAVAVEAETREVGSWTQPMIKPEADGIVAYLIKNINGMAHFLMQAKVEPGNFDIVEMAPTVQCVTGSYREDEPGSRPPFLDYVLGVSPEWIRLDSWQSEEGGRFYQEQNRNLLIEVPDDFPIEAPDNYIWLTLNQIKTFIKYNNYINVEGRCLLSSLSLG